MTSLKIRLGDHSLRSTWNAESRYQTTPETERRYWVLAAGSVLLVHGLLVVALLMAPPPKKISLMSAPAAPASVRVTMLPPPVPEPEPVVTEPPPPPQPQVITSDNAERTVAPPPPPAPKPAPEPPKAQPKPKPVPPKVTKPVPKPIKPQQPTPPAPEVPKEEAVVAPPQAQTTPPAQTVEKTLQPPASGPKDVASVGCRVPAPEYPRKAKRLRVEGETLISLVVSPQGKIEQATIARSSGNTDLDDSARQAVLGATCTPYIEGGRAVAVRAVQPISFRLTR